MSVLPLFSLAAALASAAPPRLFVLVSVDQMRAAYLERESPAGGLARLRERGAVFTEARHEHAPTETCPGHAVISTGRYPSSNGIVGNDWLDRADGLVYCAEDPLFGRSPERLSGYALADALKAARPEAKVFSVSIKDRAAIMLGGKKADFAIWFDKTGGTFTTSGYYARPSWLDGLNARLRKKGGLLLPGATDYTAVAESPAGDRLVLAAALEALRRERLGRDQTPDLLAISFSATDYVGHAHGGASAEMAGQLRSLDAVLARLFEELDDAVGEGRWDLALTADHGSTPMPSDAEGRALGLRPLTHDQLRERLESALQYQYPVKSPWIQEFHQPHVYLSTSGLAATGLDPLSARRAAAKIMAAVADVAAAYPAGEIPDSEPYAAAFRHGVYPGRSGDVLVRLKPDIALSWAGEADHGSVYDGDSRVPLVFLGPDFKPGRYASRARVVDAAPTAAAVLEVPLPGCDGTRLRDALK